MINAAAHADEVIATAAHCMSRMGQSQRIRDVRVMSALPPTSDVGHLSEIDAFVIAMHGEECVNRFTRLLTLRS